jgi:hypothetical protein
LFGLKVDFDGLVLLANGGGEGTMAAMIVDRNGLGWYWYYRSGIVDAQKDSIVGKLVRIS